MFDNMENITLLSAATGIAKPNSKVENRKTHLFLFRTSGTTRITANGESYTLHTGEMAFFPKGLSYESRKLTEEECTYFAIIFDADLNADKPKIYSLEEFPEAEFIVNHFAPMWKLGGPSDKFKCMSMFYEILAYLSGLDNLNYSEKSKLEIIAPAVKHMNEHIFDCSFKVDNLHLICGISDTYFRKIFVAKYGKTPQSYVVSKRLSHARSMLDIGHVKSISELALSVGYKDPLYFSKAFKKKYGTSPSNVN